MSEGMRLVIPGPFTLRIGFVLTKDGREDAGNLLATDCREFVRSFDSIPDAMTFLRTAFNEEKP